MSRDPINYPAVDQKVVVMHNKRRHRHQINGLFLLIFLQCGSAVLFVWDVIDDIASVGGFANMGISLVIEIIGITAFFGAIYVEAHVMRAMMIRQKKSDRSVRAAHGALQSVIAEYFDHWGLSPSERDVAGLLIKGHAITEIAHLRGVAVGTVKTQANAVYRKSGLCGRSHLVSLLIEDLLATPLVHGFSGTQTIAATPRQNDMHVG